MKKQDYNLEETKLKEVIEIIQEKIKEEKAGLQNLYNDFIGDREELWRIAERKKIYLHNLGESKEKPYFSRIDFISKDDNQKHTIYIGKHGITNNSEVVVSDWRAPISSLYYDAEIGPCSYEAPDKTMEGDLTLKRQYEIESGQLIDYHDVDLVSNDTLLQKYLNDNNEARLKSIVSTIQKEQNEVIRRRLPENIIIQGVAGSGKTTVALHRIAYLVYNYRNSIRQNQYLVIGPNPVFLKYISSVLPDLDVSGVEQFTFKDFAKQYVGEKFDIKDSNNKENQMLASIKTSMAYKQMIDLFLEMYFKTITTKDLMLGEFEVLSSTEISKVFQNMRNNSPDNLSTIIENTIEKLSHEIESKYDSLDSAYTDYCFKKYKNSSNVDEQNKIKKEMSKGKEELKKYGHNILKKYFSKAQIDPTKLYKLFISTIEEYTLDKQDIIKKLKKETLKSIKSNSYDFEDLAALVYIQSRIEPNKDFQPIRHVVIDEAQDLGLFHFYVLKKTMPNTTFSIFGDLAQSIYDYRSIHNWNDLNNELFENKANIIYLNKSYRTTSEIMSAADDVAESIGLNRSDLVVRHGNPIELSYIDEEENIPLLIADKIKGFVDKKYQTIAIISKTEEQSKKLNDDLKSIGINIPDVTQKDNLLDDSFRICTISNQLAKGLEFDAVILNNINEDNYSHQSQLDMKLLYVALTRALHELDIVYTGELTKPLARQLEKQKEYIKKK